MNFPSFSRTIALALFLFGPGAHAIADDEESAQGFVERWVDSFNKNNAKAMQGFYDKSDDLNVLVSAGLWYRGLDEVKEAYRKDEKDWKYFDSKLKNLRVREMGDFATAAFEHRFKIRSKVEKDVIVQIQIRTTMTLRKVDSGWRIISEHSSAMDGVERVTVLSE